LEKLQAFPLPPARYDWGTILSGEVWKLAHGDDFQSNPRTSVANARVQAKRRGGTVRTRMLEEGGRTAVIVQFVAAA
jgi:hypothetical protein